MEVEGVLLVQRQGSQEACQIVHSIRIKDQETVWALPVSDYLEHTQYMSFSLSVGASLTLLGTLGFCCLWTT